MSRASVRAMSAPEPATAAARAVTSPHLRQIVALPTGTGKTVIFAHLIAQVAQRGERAIVLVHRDELVGQTLEKLATVAPGLEVGVVKAERDEHAAAVVVASVQTVARRRRLERLAATFSPAIVEEAHHAMAPSWRAVLTYLRCFEPAGPLTVGFTATPERGDGADLAEVFEGITYRRDMPSMIRERYLCDGRARRILHRLFTAAPAIFTPASPSLWYPSLGRGRHGGGSCRGNWAKVAVTPLCQRDVPLQLAIELYYAERVGTLPAISGVQGTRTEGGNHVWTKNDRGGRWSTDARESQAGRVC